MIKKGKHFIQKKSYEHRNILFSQLCLWSSRVKNNISNTMHSVRKPAN